MRTYKPWTTKETQTLLRMRRLGATFEQIAGVLRRSESSTEGRYRFFYLDAEKKSRRAEQVRARRRAERVLLRRGRDAPVNRVETVKPDIEAIADRDYRRGLAPASLIGTVVGDPLPGYSALDRR
jgi:hypothetical protein